MNKEFGDLMGMSVVGNIMSRLQVKEKDRINGVESEKVTVLVPKAISHGRIDHQELAEYELKEGSKNIRCTVVDDIVIKLTTPYACALITEKDEDLVVPSYCMICRDFDEEEIDLDYVVGYLNTAYAREFFTAGVAATTNSMLKPKDVLSIPIPMLPMEEQRMLGRLYRLSAEKQQILKKMLANEEALADSIITSAVREVVKHA